MVSRLLASEEKVPRGQDCTISSSFNCTVKSVILHTIGGSLCLSDSHAVSSCYVIYSNHLHSLQVISPTAEDTYSDNSPNSQDSYNTTALRSDKSYANTPPSSLAQICNSGRSSSLSCQPVQALSALQHPADKPLRVQPLNIKRTFEYGRRSRWLGVR